MPKRKNSACILFIFFDRCVSKGTLWVKPIFPLLFWWSNYFLFREEEAQTKNRLMYCTKKIKDSFSELPSGIIGIGGGTVTRYWAKSSGYYVGPTRAVLKPTRVWDLGKKTCYLSCGYPRTIKWHWAEVSRTTVLMGPEKKLGINSDIIPLLTR